MAQKTILYWRDIPSQVIVKLGRKPAKKLLSERFQEAIDAAAMRGKKSGTEDYLAEWRRGDAVECSDDIEAEVEACAQSLEDEYDDERLKALVANYGNND
ncbi:MAG: hypothetical protein HON65_13050 [Rhodospirillales bacterium]|jgi:hypothetical protein|nr:hypothetical protein [Rhodospirillales bacterium]